MTKEQFIEQIERLSNTYGREKWNSGRIEAMWKNVNGLDITWLINTIDKALLIGNDRFNFLEAITAEKQRIASEKRTQEILEHHKFQEGIMTEKGFEQVLKSFKSNSLLDALENARPSKIKLDDKNA